MLHQENDKTSQKLLNSKDLALLKDRDLFLRKRELADKINSLFGNCIEIIRGELNIYNEILPLEISSSSPKITKGENYLGFPWTILDYPRYFDKDAIFALRLLCWWGNNFSITLHLSGTYADKYSSHLFSKWEKLRETDLLICVNEDPWQHHHEGDNYMRIKDCENDSNFYEDIAKRTGFIKICSIIPLEQWSELPKKCSENSKLLFSLLM